ncbi:50S ribosomal protein L24 [Williamsoniiplasma somnilux]|uniref:Large ribosomal subunit protein uL24 n=1 Tax=Williamsoniiplasma somnilux TaxID=215578 RepID=A0A2K8NY90_9MOLU|nr:50S ribosomal protein L24 [Williamsoniiplasma somnilux]ATZ18526.1 50S ribosomal protein L24 [Williamsoniiplasma somnilux]
MAKSKLLKGDIVKVISGSRKGESGPITSLSKDKKFVTVQGIDVIKHVKPSQTDTEGGIKKVPAKLNASNVGLLDPKQKESTTRVGYSIENGKKVRIAKKSNSQVK